MGFLTNISISNDFWHTIAANPDKLVEAISVGMNDGIEGPVSEVYREVRKDATEWSQYYHVRSQTPQGVTVHQARHYDTPQVIVNPYGHHAIAAHEIPGAIDLGWLEIPYRRNLAEKTVQELRELADRIEERLNRADANARGVDPAPSHGL